MTSLEELDLSDCTALKHLPEALGKLTKLERLDVSDCPALTALPESIGALTKLRCRTDELGFNICHSGMPSCVTLPSAALSNRLPDAVDY